MIADTDIVERLEGQAASRIHSPVHRSLFREAAAALAERDTEIVRLRGEVDKLQILLDGLTLSATIAPAEAKGDASLAKLAYETWASTPPAGEGWALVPREPTDEMLDAGIDARCNALAKGGSGHPTADTWSAMIEAAAPRHETGEG